tara:strand:- start:1262 stop:1972 length:711 start_codon:yes stop_codon:yes gene_type:complete
MRLPLDWILQEPIDREHKEYVLLDYISKIDKELEELNLYPAFQEISLHLANLNSITKNLNKLVLKKAPEEIDDEILVAHLSYKKLNNFSNEELTEIINISKEANEKLRDYFLIAKSIWSIVFESILIKPKNKNLKLTPKNANKGYLTFEYNGEKFLYEFSIKKIHRKYEEKKCTFTLIERGEEITHKLKKGNVIFEAKFDNEFPLEGCLLSLVKRKVINYISQTIKLGVLKESNLK